MFIDNTLVFKTRSVEVAIKAAITTMYKPEVGEEFIAVLKFEDGVGKCTQTDDFISANKSVWKYTTYFIPTIINSKLIKIEVCSEGERVSMNEYIYLYAFNVNGAQEFHKLSQESHDELVKSPDINKRYLRRLIHTGEVEVRYGKQD